MKKERRYSVCKTILNISILIVSLILLSTQKANALACKLTSDNTVTETVNLDSLIFLSGSSNSDIIWYSPSYTRDITCSSGIEENIYVYPYPVRSSQTFPSGVKMGLILDGEDLGTFTTSGTTIANRKDTGWRIKKNSPESKTLTFQAYMVKEGDIDTTKITSGITLFRLDGVGGINTTPNSNYNMYITGWDNAGTVNCDTSLSVTPITLSGIMTDKAYAGTENYSTSYSTISLSCTSSSGSILNAVSSVKGKFSISGSALSDDNTLFSTNQNNLGLAVSYDGSVMSPGSSTTVNIPIASGKGSKTLSLGIKPQLFSLELNNPSWLFEDKNDINSSFNFSFSPTLVN
ncbi:hypothetical protein [Erwinia psidii]|nr:hypothetical protein [Erwinia psidii]MCX8956901.1 hypothetical protein [Erwinia psidii]MCX8960288.1 hypothetical protein [Erwinia psidii]MCX8964532.1 hypothetical protein [Erwinia psidii]